VIFQESSLARKKKGERMERKGVQLRKQRKKKRGPLGLCAKRKRKRECLLSAKKKSSSSCRKKKKGKLFGAF